MKKEWQKREKRIGIYIIIFCGMLLLFAILIYGHSLSRQKMEGLNLSDGWQYQCGAETRSNYSMKDKVTIRPGNVYQISRRLPAEFGNADSLYFVSQSVAVRVFVKEKLIYEYGFDTTNFDRTPGDFVHFINLPESAQGEEVTIEVFCPYKNASKMINNIYLVNDEQQAMMLMRQKIIPVLMCLFVAFLSLICMIFEVILLRRIFGNPCLVYISLFLLCLSAWSLTQTQIIPLIWDQKYYIGSMAYILLSFLPVLMVKYVNERYEIKGKRLARFMVSLTFTACVLVHVLNITGVWEYTENLIITHAALVASAIYLIVMGAVKKEVINSVSVRRLLPFSVAVLIVCGSLDVANSYLTLLRDYSFFSRFGILVLSLSIFLDVVDQSLHMVRLGEASDLNRVKAMTDALTGLENRMALDLAVNEIQQGNPDEKEYGLIIFDVNDLKKTNDKLGHEAGDKLLVAAGKLIARACLARGRAYRYGGDEFVVVVLDNAEKKVADILKNFEALITEFNTEKIFIEPLFIASGSCIHKVKDNSSVEEIFKKADEEMYIHKKQMKNVVE